MALRKGTTSAAPTGFDAIVAELGGALPLEESVRAVAPASKGLTRYRAQTREEYTERVKTSNSNKEDLWGKHLTAAVQKQAYGSRPTSAKMGEDADDGAYGGSAGSLSGHHHHHAGDEVPTDAPKEFQFETVIEVPFSSVEGELSEADMATLFKNSHTGAPTIVFSEAKGTLELDLPAEDRAMLTSGEEAVALLVGITGDYHTVHNSPQRISFPGIKARVGEQGYGKRDGVVEYLVKGMDISKKDCMLQGIALLPEREHEDLHQRAFESWGEFFLRGEKALEKCVHEHQKEGYALIEDKTPIVQCYNLDKDGGDFVNEKALESPSGDGWVKMQWPDYAKYKAMALSLAQGIHRFNPATFAIHLAPHQEKSLATGKLSANPSFFTGSTIGTARPFQPKINGVVKLMILVPRRD